MGSFTLNYNLFKPDGPDLIDEDVDLNANYDIIDGLIKDARDDIDGTSDVINDWIADWTTYNCQLKSGGTLWTPGNGVISAAYKKPTTFQTVDFRIRVSAGSTTNFQAGQITFALPVPAGPMGASGSFIMIGPQKQGSWRNNAPTSDIGVLLEGGQTTIATTASLVLTVSSDLWITGSYPAN